MGRLPRLGHGHLKVRDLERSIDFYCELLGWAVTERVGAAYAFLSGGIAHHELALQAIGADARGPDEHGVGLYHLAFEFEDVAGLRGAMDRAKSLGRPASLVDHGISFAAYLADPDGNGIELYVDRRDAAGGMPLWDGRSIPMLSLPDSDGA